MPTLFFAISTCHKTRTSDDLPSMEGGEGKRNPAEVLISALSAGDLDVRLTEALLWVLLRFPDLDWRWLVAGAKLNDLQNRLGFVTRVARRLAEISGDVEKAALLGRQEAALERSRLMREDTLCHDSWTEPERAVTEGESAGGGQAMGAADGHVPGIFESCRLSLFQCLGSPSRTWT